MITKPRKYIIWSFEKDYYERPLVGAKDIMIRGGNRDYAVEIENPSILEVTVDLSSPADMGNLEIHPKQKGETTIKVRDKVAKRNCRLENQDCRQLPESGCCQSDKTTLPARG